MTSVDTAVAVMIRTSCNTPNRQTSIEYEEHPNRFTQTQSSLSSSPHIKILFHLLTLSSMLIMVSSFTLPSSTTSFPPSIKTTPFLMRTRNQIHTKHTLHHPIRRYRIQSSSVTKLHMVVTKSGGRPISSDEQFQVEVLNKIVNGSDDTESVGLVTDGDSDDTTSKTDNDDDERLESEDSSAITATLVDDKMEEEKEDKPVLVFFSAPWCGPCRLSNPVVKEIIKEFVPIIDVVEVCTDDLPEVAEGAGVVSIPTIQLYYKGELLDTIVGCVAKNVLSSAVIKVLEDLGFEEVEDDEDFEDEEEEDDVIDLVDESES